ncbi:unnamed protein product [Symbiodinium microadriaticum]|nr:unnamed protein product [Symbiodinium microadriaticum]CAE7268720.1 unnamed protein product [Symbiodinium sp. KB8]
MLTDSLGIIKKEETSEDELVPEWVRKEWSTGDKTKIASVLQEQNFDKANFLVRLEVIVRTKISVTLQIEEGWYSEQEMEEDLHWRNQYDGQTEYWVVVKEKGLRAQEQSRETAHKQDGEAAEMPKVPAHLKNQKMLDDYNDRSEKPQEPQQIDPKQHQNNQLKSALGKMLDSAMDKTAKLRSLKSDLSKKYTQDDDCKKSLKTLESCIAEIEKHYDDLNLAKAQCDASDPAPEFHGFHVQTEKRIKEATLACARATAAEMKIKILGVEDPAASSEGSPATLGQESATLSEIHSRCESIGCIAFKLPPFGSLAGKALKHCLDELSRLFDKHSPLIFKIGWTHDASWRWANDLYGYARSIDKWTNMDILYIAKEPFSPAMLEAALIEKYQRREGCRNVQAGGETTRASCASAVRTAKNVVEDLGQQQAQGRLLWYVMVTRDAADGKGVKKPYIKHETNLVGHTLTTHFLAGVLPRNKYGDNDCIFDALLTGAAEQAKEMCTTGVVDREGRKFNMFVLRTIGDWPWLAKSGKLCCTFANAVKKQHQHANHMCHLCGAGPDMYPFEEIATKTPAWASTLGLSEPFYDTPAMAIVPHTPGRLAEHYAFDIFHTIHLGIGRNFLGSALALLSERESAGNVDERFNAITEKYLTWCAATSHPPITHKITKDLISWPATTDYPSGAWYKAELTTTLLEWFESLDGNFAADDEVMSLAMEACKSLNSFVRLLFRSGAWLSAEDGGLAAQFACRFLRRYSQLASWALREARTLSASPLGLADESQLRLYYNECSRGRFGVLNGLLELFYETCRE